MENLQNPQIKINPRDLKWLDCGCDKHTALFEDAVMFKHLPKLMSPSGKEEIIPVEVVLCKTCGKIPQFYANKIQDLPKDLLCESSIKPINTLLDV
jgi:hypothetical protein